MVNQVDEAELVALPVSKSAQSDGGDAGGELETSDTSFEVALDEKPAPPPRVNTPVGLAEKDPVFQPVIPEHLRTLEGVRSTFKRALRRVLHPVKFHSVRVVPIYLPVSVFWGLVGLLKGIKRQLRWWWAAELATGWDDAKDSDAKIRLHREIKNTRQHRGRLLLAEAAGVSIGGVCLWFLAPWWAWLVVIAIALPFLAHLGRPENKPIISTAVIRPKYRVINHDVVLAAYYSAGLGVPDKIDPKTGQVAHRPDAPDMKIQFETFLSRNSQDNGSHVKVILPRGKTFSDAFGAREKLASALDVALSQVYLTKDKTSNRRHQLLILDEDPLAVAAGRTPLLDCKVRDIWKALSLGLDEHGHRVLLPLMFQSLLIGAQPRRGKSFTLRLILLFCALDPYVRLSVFDGAGKPDLRHFALVCYTYGFGLLPNKTQGDPVQNLVATLRTAKKEIQERNVRLSALPTSLCPEGKLTRDIARDRSYGMPVWVIALDEFQEYLKTGDEIVDQEIAALLVYAVRVGPSVGVIILSSTQRPAGLGSGNKVKQAFADYRDNHLMRFALKTGSSKVSDYILGEGVHSEGFDSSDLPVGDEYRGIGILYDAPVEPCTVRCYLADGEDAKRILIAARKHRERAHTLDGMAAGEEVTVQPRDPLAATLDVFLPGESWAAWRDLAARLSEQLPEQYAGVTGAGLGSALRGLKLGVESSDGRVTPSTDVPSGVTSGVKHAVLERALARRSREETAP